MNIAFRVDGSSTIGLGHYYRCVTLAQALCAADHHCIFISQYYPEKLSNTLQVLGIEIHKLPKEQVLDQEKDAQLSFQMIGNQQLDWLIVDHYGLDATWHKALKDLAKRRLVIDDLANRHYDCEVLLDSTYLRQPFDYEGLCPSNTRLLLGADYILLREQFLHRRVNLDKLQRDSDRLFIHFGAVDHLNMTAKTLSLLEAIEWPGKVDIVLSSEAKFLKQIKTLVMRHQSWHLYVDIDNMADVMAACNAAIGAGSTNSWERCSLGLPSLVIQVADNQSDIIDSLHQAGAITVSTAEKLMTDLPIFLKSDLKTMAKNAFNVCDGLGVSRTLDFLNQLGKC